jgi:hypothetical protein
MPSTEKPVCTPNLLYSPLFLSLPSLSLSSFLSPSLPVMENIERKGTNNERRYIYCGVKQYNQLVNNQCVVYVDVKNRL